MYSDTFIHSYYQVKACSKSLTPNYMMGRTAERSSEIQVHYIRQSSEQKTRVESQRIRALANRNLVPVQKRVGVSKYVYV